MSINEIVKKIILIFFCLLVTGFAQADPLLDFGFVYSGETFNTTASSSDTQYFYNASLLFNLDTGQRCFIGWNVFGISQASVAASTTTNYSSLDMGPSIRWNIDKAGTYSLTGTYGYLAKATYSSGSSSENWEGSSLLAQFAIQAASGRQKIFLGLSLNYYSATYTKKVVSRVESSNSAQKSWIFPMITLTWRP